MLKRMVRNSLGKFGYKLSRSGPNPELSELQQKLEKCQRDFSQYQLQRAEPVSEIAELREKLERCQQDLTGYRIAYDETSRDLGGYKGSYEHVSRELAIAQLSLAECKRDLDGFKNAYDTICTQLSDTNVVLRQNKIDPEIVKEAALADPPVIRRLKDDPAVAAAVVAEATKHDLSEKLVDIFKDPDFSIEDRSKYMRLSHVASPPIWDQTAAVVAKVVEGQYLKYQPRYHDSEKVTEQAATLRREGVLKLGTMFDEKQIREIQDYFLKRPIFNGHIPMSARHRGLRRYVNYTAERFPIGCYSVQEIALAPHLLEVALSPMILDTAAAYFGCAPRLTWLQSWWNFAGAGDYPHRQNFYHRDSNDFGMFWVYMYLTDVDEGSGPHKLIRRSGDFSIVRERFERAQADPSLAKQLEGISLNDLNGLGHGISDHAKEAIFDGLTEQLTGPAGTVFVTRGVDYHKVVTPLIRKRQIYAARFCINEFNYPGPDRDGDRVPSEVVAERVGSDEQLRYVTGLRFDWSNCQ